MESKKLEALLMAVDLGSFTKAAEVLGYTQSGLTHMMNSLEREVGFPLLERGRMGVSLTEEGERIAPAIRDFLQANSRLDHAIAQVVNSHSEVIRVSAYASMAMHWLPGIIQTFREECPEVNVDIRMADDVDTPFDLLVNGKMDVIFASRHRQDELFWLPLKNDTMYAVLPGDYPVENEESFPLEGFEGKDFIMPSQGYDKEIMKVFSKKGVKPNVLPTWVDDPAVINMVQHGLGISMMCELTLKGRADAVRLLPVAPESYRELGLAMRGAPEEGSALYKFMKVAQRWISENGY